MKKMLLILMILVNVLMCSVVFCESVTDELSENLLRMHIIANSDNDHDQMVKILVRNKICNALQNDKYLSKKEVISELKKIEKNLNLFLENNSIGYKCKIFYSLSEFPEKKYKNINMPSGKYECVKIILGEGRGKNWWCIAYPSLCFNESFKGCISTEGDKILKENLSEESYKILQKGNVEYRIKFKTIDIINKIISKYNNIN